MCKTISEVTKKVINLLYNNKIYLCQASIVPPCSIYFIEDLDLKNLIFWSYVYFYFIVGF